MSVSDIYQYNFKAQGEKSYVEVQINEKKSPCT